MNWWKGGKISTRRYVSLALTLAIYAVLGLGAVYNQSYGIPENWPSDELTWVVQSMLERGSLSPNTYLYPAGPFLYASLVLAKIVLFFFSNSALQTAIIIHVCRSVNALFFLLTVWFAERTVRLVCGRTLAPFAALMVGGSVALIHHAHLATVNSGAFFGMVLAVYYFAKTIISKRPAHFYLAVGACSLAVGFKYNSVFLFLGLALVWILAFGSIAKRQFLKDVVVSLALAPIPFLLTNPFFLLDFSKAQADLMTLIAQEIPAFQVSTISLWDKVNTYFTLFVAYGAGFLTMLGLRIIFITLAVWLAVSGVIVIRRKASQPAAWKDFVVRQKVMSVLLALFAVHTATNFNTGILQSRYYIPSFIFLLLTFLIAFYSLRDWLGGQVLLPVKWGMLVEGTVLCVVGVCAFLTIINAYAHVAAFGWAPKSLASEYALSKVEADPSIRIGILAYPERSPFQRGNPVLESRLAIFMTMVPPARKDIETWDEYLLSIKDYFREQAPRYIIAEDIIFSWPLFLPQEYAKDYSKRVLYPNPGYAAWAKILGELGYQRIEQLTYRDQYRWVNTLIGDDYIRTTEGAGGDVYIFEKN